MTPEQEQQLLQSESLGDFLTALRHTLPEGESSLADAADLLSRHGGTSNPATISRYENGLRGISSTVQLIYVRAFGLSDELRLKLQELAGAPFSESVDRLAS